MCSQKYENIFWERHFKALSEPVYSYFFYGFGFNISRRINKYPENTLSGYQFCHFVLTRFIFGIPIVNYLNGYWFVVIQNNLNFLTAAALASICWSSSIQNSILSWKKFLQLSYLYFYSI